MDIIAQKVLNDILKYRGKNFVVLCAIEEMSELIKELLKDINRNKNNTQSVIDELSDVYLMLEFLKQIYNVSDKNINDISNIKIQQKWLPRIEKWVARADQLKNDEVK